MKAHSLIMAILLISIGCSHKEKEKQKEYEVVSNSTEASARVTNVDYTKRTITMQTIDGPVTIKAGEEVKNLNQIKKGDMVVASYNQALVYSLDKGGKAGSEKLSHKEWTAMPGQEPEAGSSNEFSTTVKITSINREKPTVTLQNADGDEQTFKVAHPERLEELKVGDTVRVKYTEAIALKVEKKKTI